MNVLRSRTSAVVCAMFLLSSCISSLVPNARRGGASAPLGSFTVGGPAFGERTLSPTICSTGERQLFMGFDLSDDESGIVTRLVVDPATGPVVRLFERSAQFDRTLLFHRSDCRTFHFFLDSTGWRINRVQQLGVSLELDCQLPSGDRIAGKAADKGCL